MSTLCQVYFYIRKLSPAKYSTDSVLFCYITLNIIRRYPSDL